MSLSLLEVRSSWGLGTPGVESSLFPQVEVRREPSTGSVARVRRCGRSGHAGVCRAPLVPRARPTWLPRATVKPLGLISEERPTLKFFFSSHDSGTFPGSPLVITVMGWRVFPPAPNSGPPGTSECDFIWKYVSLQTYIAKTFEVILG